VERYAFYTLAPFRPLVRAEVEVMTSLPFALFEYTRVPDSPLDLPRKRRQTIGGTLWGGHATTALPVVAVLPRDYP
jgi:hypothetical protein